MNTIASAAPTDDLAQDPVTRLNSVRRLVEEQYTCEQPLTRAALHLIDCATDIVAQLPGGNLDAARGALSSARAAVVSATFAVGRIHDMSMPGTERV
ncbi:MULTISPECIES: hypothetical protein [Frankia]|uniref:hypothetical protein n=1 Tax=Frankia TaxID=1854 RepID=UPI0002EB64B5|nr:MULTISPECIES: hypothetical protein [Frankia]